MFISRVNEQRKYLKFFEYTHICVQSIVIKITPLLADHVIFLLFRKSDHSFIFVLTVLNMGFPGGTVVKNPAKAEDTGDVGSIPGSGRSPGVGNGNPLQYSCLENSMDREASVQFSCSIVSNSLRPHEL